MQGESNLVKVSVVLLKFCIAPITFGQKNANEVEGLPG